MTLKNIWKKEQSQLVSLRPLWMDPLFIRRRYLPSRERPSTPREFFWGEKSQKMSVLRIRDVYPGSRIRIFSIPDFGSRIHINEFKYFNPQKIVSKLSEIWSRLFIPDPDFDFFLPIPDPRIKKEPDPGYGSETLKNICCKSCCWPRWKFRAG